MEMRMRDHQRFNRPQRFSAPTSTILAVKVGGVVHLWILQRPE